MSFELVVVGGGNMGAALLGGLLASGTVEPGTVAVVETIATRRDELEQLFPGVAVAAVMPSAGAAVIAVKPNDVAGAVGAAVAAGAHRLLSIAAGVTTGAIVAAAGPGVAVVRAMPNTPALVRRGVSALAAGAGSTEADLEWAEQILRGVGFTVRVDESQLDAVTGLTGSGPAYVFLVAEALIDAGVTAGLAPSIVEPMVVQLLEGSAALLAERGDPAALRSMVTSPGGTTAAGLAALETRAVRAAFIEAVRAATERSRELGNA